MGRWIYKVDFLVRKSGETRYHNKAKFTSEEIAKERILYLFKSLKKQKILRLKTNRLLIKSNWFVFLYLIIIFDEIPKIDKKIEPFRSLNLSIFANFLMLRHAKVSPIFMCIFSFPIKLV
ncbi:hypothetical protein A5798_000020 [Enterococcus sp. 6C8_DIV0013]|nr:hypothetical protein A5798_000020 [Enterococcus sp. 6C8_DIV0013]